jgi:Leucine-rich repeat (LRR) protein
LEYLHLSNNNLSDLSPLYNLENIRTVYLANNPGISKSSLRALQKALCDARTNKIKRLNPGASEEKLRELIARSSKPRIEHSVDLTEWCN